MTQKYSIEDGNVWREIYESGLTFEQIGLEVGADGNTIRMWAMRAGCVPRSTYRGGMPNQAQRHTDGIQGASRPSLKSSPTYLAKASRRRGRY